MPAAATLTEVTTAAAATQANQLNELYLWYEYVVLNSEILFLSFHAANNEQYKLS